ncbi:MAG TPA: 3-oxoacyl-[acyl-carrier-protein] synthase III C-terminal domain-containing protein [Vicinamibacteria bacterium]|nr:3-oxoacyl-[acyl-carrier-protein] synthase III C-terminal domain-containing protein [Vicinamibacteria bacterium]
MTRAVITGSGSEIAATRVTNAQMARILDTTDEWIRERSGIEQRHFASPGVASSDLGVAAATKALAAAGVAKEEIDLVVFATMTPDHYFPGNGTLLQDKLGLPPVPCFDVRQQCSGFLYGLQLADAHVRAGMAKTVLLVGADVHIGFMPWTRENFAYAIGESEVPPTKEEWDWNSRFRHLVVLFGDAGSAVVVRAVEDGDRGVLDQELHAAGAEYEKLYVPGTGFKHRPYTDPEQFRRGDHIPVMDGRHVFKMATTNMVEVARSVLQRNDVAPGELKLVLMHQANKRINEHCARTLGLRDDQVPHNIHKFGNTTSATIPLLWDECARDGRLRPGDLVLLVAFGAGMTWGASLVRA